MPFQFWEFLGDKKMVSGETISLIVGALGLGVGAYALSSKSSDSKTTGSSGFKMPSLNLSVPNFEGVPNYANTGLKAISDLKSNVTSQSNIIEGLKESSSNLKNELEKTKGTLKKTNEKINEKLNTVLDKGKETIKKTTIGLMGKMWCYFFNKT
jgi:peptidoglycan hydrolase CwlO-like protein